MWFQDCRTFLNLVNGMQGDRRRYIPQFTASKDMVWGTWGVIKAGIQKRNISVQLPHTSRSSTITEWTRITVLVTVLPLSRGIASIHRINSFVILRHLISNMTFLLNSLNKYSIYDKKKVWNTCIAKDRCT